MSTMKLVYDTTEITFAPAEGYIFPEDLNVARLESISGKEYSYKFYAKKKWSIPLVFIASADKDNINSWWREIRAVVFYPDLVNAPSTNYNVRIRNADAPLVSFPITYWEDGYMGTLELREL